MPFRKRPKPPLKRGRPSESEGGGVQKALGAFFFTLPKYDEFRAVSVL